MLPQGADDSSRLNREMSKARSKPAVLLLGGSGFVGGSFRDYATDRGWSIQAPNSKACNLADPCSVERFAKRAGKIDAIVCAASAREDRDSFAGARKNLDIAFGCARLVELLRPDQLVYLSSVDVFGRPPSKPTITELSPPKLDSPYAASKFAAEHLLMLACSRVKTQCVILRLPGVFGRNDTSNRIIPAMLRSARQKKTLTVNGDGRQKRDLVWNDDVSRFVGECILGKAKGCVLNFATGKSLSILQMCRALRRLGVRVNVRLTGRSSHDFDLRFDTRRLRKVFAKFRFTPFEEALSKTLARS